MAVGEIGKFCHHLLRKTYLYNSSSFCALQKLRFATKKSVHKIKLSYKASATRYSIEVEKESRKFGHEKNFFFSKLGRCHNFSWVVEFSSHSMCKNIPQYLNISTTISWDNKVQKSKYFK